MKIATAPCNWNNGDISDFRPYTPHGQMMDEMVDAGYSATEWGPGMPDDPGVVREEMAKRGLAMVGAFVRLGYRDRDAWDEADAAALAVAERVKAAGGSILVAAELGDERRDAEACEKKYALRRVLERFPLTSELQVRQGLGKVQEACAVAYHPIRILKNCYLRP